MLGVQIQQFETINDEIRNGYRYRLAIILYITLYMYSVLLAIKIMPCVIIYERIMDIAIHF